MPSSWTRGNGRVLEWPREPRIIVPRPRSCRTLMALIGKVDPPGVPWPECVTSITVDRGRLIISYGGD